jgi:uncharacterized membrane protein
MKYSVEIEINAPIDRVVELFDNSDNLKEWMDGLESFEIISGEPGQSGAISKLVYQMGKRRVEMIETILVRNLPEDLSSSYKAKGVYNIVKNHFKELPEGKTLYITDQEFQFEGFMKIIGFIMPGAFKKQSMQYLEKFKAFVEKEQ